METSRNAFLANLISETCISADEMIITNSKYTMSEVKTSVYSVQMRLVIMNLQKHDLGGYKCISKNSIGDAEGNIRLYGEFPRLTRRQERKQVVKFSLRAR